MEINPNRSVNPVNPTAAPAKAKSVGAPAPTNGDASFEQSSGLSAALAATPDSRADVVIRAENLVASSSYPPTEVIKRIANLLAANLLTQDN
jgi:hypothetical protein